MKDHSRRPLDPDALRHLRDLVARINAFKGPWATTGGGERIDEQTISMPWVDMDELAYEAMTFLYENNLIVGFDGSSMTFDWAAWDEGRALFRDPAPDRFDRLDRETVLKLLTAVARNDRFNEGAWASLFEEGDAQRLFQRLLEIELTS
jgi:hypothetical protein